MKHKHILLLLCLCLSAANSWPAQGQTTCPADYVLLDANDALENLLAKLDARAVRRVGSTAPSSMQITAPSTAQSQGTTLVDGADHANILGLAYESGVLQNQDDGRITLNLNLFSLRLLSGQGSDLWYLQEKYDENVNRRLRRFSVTASFLGKGESLDQDGDGEADEALEAKALDDIATWEFRWRFLGSRDRRENSNWTRAKRKIGDKTFRDVVSDVAHQRADFLSKLVGSPIFDQVRYGKTQCVNLDKLADEILGNNDLLETLTAHELSVDKFKAAYNAILEEIEKRPILSLVLGGTEQKDEFGPDKEFVALRGDWGIGKGKTVKLNLDWNRMESLMEGAEEPEMLKAGLEGSGLWLQGSQLFPENTDAYKDGVKISFAASWEMFDNVPSAKHDTLTKFSAKLELPITEGLKLPISVTYADHVDLLTDEDEVVGHIGLSWDVSKLFKKSEDA
jgi:hypothetical protein